MNEKADKARFLERLEPHFHIHEEVFGIHLWGSRVRIDAIVRPKVVEPWANKAIALGVEFKDDSAISANTDTRDVVSWLAQCEDYANTNWNDYGFVHVFAASSTLFSGSRFPLVFDPGAPYDYERRFFAGYLGMKGVGVLEESQQHGRRFVLHGWHTVWSEYGGVAEGRFNKLRIGWGSSR
jgi:hypothetical protein